MADQHPPEGGEDRAEADPGLKGQQPQPHEAAHDGAADAREQARVPPQTLPAGASGKPCAREGEQQALQQGEQRRPGRESKPRARKGEAEQNRPQRGRRQETAQQTVEQTEAVHRGKGAAEDPGGVLPVAAYPAVLPLEKGQGRVGEGVGDGGVAQIAAVQQRALQRVVGEDAPLRQGFRAGQQELQVDQPLTREAAAVEGVHVQLSVQAAVGIAAAGPGKDEREVGRGRALELGLDARVEDAVAGGDRAVRPQARGVERMQRRGDQLSGRAGHDAGIRVEGQDEARACEGGRVPRDRKRRGLAREQAGQLQQRAALALPSAPLLAVKAAPARKEKEPAPVAAVELLHGTPRLLKQRLILRHAFPRRARQIGEQAEEQVLPLAATQKAQFLQALGRTAAEQHGEHAQRPALRRDARLGIEPRQTPGRGCLQQREIGQALDQRPDRHRQQQADPEIAQGEGQRERAEERQQDQGRDIQARAAGAALREQEKADVLSLPLRLFKELPRKLLLLNAAPFGQQREPVEIGALRGAVHPRVDARALLRKQGGADVRLFEHRVEVRLAQPSKRAEQRRDRRRQRLRVGGGAQAGALGADALEHGGAQGRGKEQKLLPLQDRHRLEALQKEGAALGRDGAVARLQERPAELRHQQAVPAAPLARAGTQGVQNAGSLAQQQPAVVEQPFTGGGDVRGVFIAAAKERVAALRLLQRPAQTVRSGAPVAPALGPQGAGAGGRVGAEALVFDIGDQMQTVHSFSVQNCFFPEQFSL